MKAYHLLTFIVMRSHNVTLVTKNGQKMECLYFFSLHFEQI